MQLLNYADVTNHLNTLRDTHLIRLVYVSQISYQARRNTALYDDIETETLPYCQANNIKGCLCCSRKSLIHCLEGPKPIILSFLLSVFNDIRYKGVRVILIQPIAACRFLDWQLHSQCLEKGQDTPLASNLEQFLPFKPYDWHSWQAEYFVDVVQHENKKKDDGIVPSDVTHNGMFVSLFLFPIIILSVLLLLGQMFRNFPL